MSRKNELKNKELLTYSEFRQRYFTNINLDEENQFSRESFLDLINQATNLDQTENKSNKTKSAI